MNRGVGRSDKTQWPNEPKFTQHKGREADGVDSTLASSGLARVGKLNCWANPLVGGVPLLLSSGGRKDTAQEQWHTRRAMPHSRNAKAGNGLLQVVHAVVRRQEAGAFGDLLLLGGGGFGV